MNDTGSIVARFEAAFSSLPLVAILRGIAPAEADAVGAALYETGFRLIEVPLNSPDPLESIARLRRALPDDALVGAGTVLQTTQIQSLKSAGGEWVVMPHADLALIRAAKAARLPCVPGVTTPTEAFGALSAGADALKLFPAEMLTPPVIKALRAVLPRTARLLPVGGISPDNMSAYIAASADGFGLGSALYAAGASAEQVKQRAQRFVTAWRSR